MNEVPADDGTSREFNEFMFTPTYFGLANFGVDFPSTISRWKLDRGFKKVYSTYDVRVSILQLGRNVKSVNFDKGPSLLAPSSPI